MNYTIPITVTVNENVYTIRDKGDYRMVLDVFTALNDIELEHNERILAALYIFYDQFEELEDILRLDEATLVELVQEMFRWLNCGRDKAVGEVSHKTIDWETDAQMICAAINPIAHTEVRAVEYIHWWTFMGYFMAIGESTLSTVVSIRSKIIKGKKLEKYEKEFKAENPQYFNWNHKTMEEQEADAWISEVWNKG